MEKHEIFQKTRAVIINIFCREPDLEVKLEHDLGKDLGIINLDLVFLIAVLDKEFHIVITRDDVHGIKTVDDLIDCIASRLPKN